jgi:hypothetical protein
VFLHEIRLQNTYAKHYPELTLMVISATLR